MKLFVKLLWSFWKHRERWLEVLDWMDQTKEEQAVEQWRRHRTMWD